MGKLIRISDELTKLLETKKLVPNETYDHLLKRLLNKVSPGVGSNENLQE